MSFAECSVRNDPLLQLNKQVNDTRQLPGLGERAGQLPAAGQHVSLRSKRYVMGAEGKQLVRNFLDHAAIPLPQIEGSSKQSIPFAKHSNTKAARHLTQNNAWSQEFRNISQNSNMRAQVMAGPELNQMGSTRQFAGSNNVLSSQIIPRDAKSVYTQNLGNHDQRNITIPDQDWDKRFQELEDEVSKNLVLDDAQYEKEITDSTTYQKEFQQVWDSIHEDSEDLLSTLENAAISGNKWDYEYSDYAGARLNGDLDYKFENKNNYANNPNAYEIGCILMENGAKLSEAAMAFEAAVKNTPEHVNAWLKLGLVQIQNEKELSGIIALEKCLQLDSNNLEAIKNLAISYINEGYDMSAFSMLNRWAATKYPSISDQSGDELGLDNGDYNHLNDQLINRFVTLKEKLGIEVDADIHLCLGLLHYVRNDYDKTIECFRSALDVNSRDELMWNRLGASLANSNRPEEAVHAYCTALQLKPSFVRARYNLAVASLNLGCLNEAAGHLLTAMKMHEVEGLERLKQFPGTFDAVTSTGYHNDNILSTLRRVVIAMDREDVLDLIIPGMDIQAFRQKLESQKM